MKMCLTVLAITLIVAHIGWTQSGLVSWINWSKEPGVSQVLSGLPGVKAMVTLASDNQVINTVDELASAGWNVENGCIVTPQQSGGSKLVLHVTGLPVGAHTVYVRLHMGPREPGNEWWYITNLALTDGTAAGDTRLISGMGGYDRSSMYEVRQGTVGTAEKGVSELTLSIERYVWSQFSRIGSIRIETDISINVSYTSVRSSENDAVRAELAKEAVLDASGKTAYCLGVVPGSTTVRPKSFDLLKGLVMSPSIDISSAKGEYESQQVLVFSDSQDLKGVNLRASELNGPDGSVIPADCIMAAPLGYVKYSSPFELNEHGYWPDPILNFMNIFDVAKDDVQSVWYRVFVPRDARPGYYTGKLSLAPANAPAFELPVKVRVWDFEVPKMSHLKVFAGGNASDDFEISYKINPSNIYGFHPDFVNKFPEWAEAGITAINLHYIAAANLEDKANKLPSQTQLDRLCDDLEERLKALEAAGLRDKAYFYMFDEANAEWFPAIRKVCAAVKARFPDLKIMTTAHADWKDLEQMDIFVPLLKNFSRDKALELHQQGKQLCWYTCNSPIKPYPNVLINNTALDTRVLMGFMAFAYATDGFLYYATRGGAWQSCAPITTGPYTNWPINDTGHDHLYQKGPDGKGLPSRRMEMIRDGLEDYDYLFIASSLVERLRNQTGVPEQLIKQADAIEQYGKPGNGLVRSLTDYTQSVQDLESTRWSIGSFIEEAEVFLSKSGKDG